MTIDEKLDEMLQRFLKSNTPMKRLSELVILSEVMSHDDAKQALTKLIADEVRKAHLLEASHRATDALDRMLRLDRDATIEFIKAYARPLTNPTEANESEI